MGNIKIPFSLYRNTDTFPKLLYYWKVSMVQIKLLQNDEKHDLQFFIFLARAMVIYYTLLQFFRFIFTKSENSYFPKKDKYKL